MAAKYNFGSKSHHPLDPDNPPDGWYHIDKLVYASTIRDLTAILKGRDPKFWTDARIASCQRRFERDISNLLADELDWAINDTALDLEEDAGLHDEDED